MESAGQGLRHRRKRCSGSLSLPATIVSFGALHVGWLAAFQLLSLSHLSRERNRLSVSFCPREVPSSGRQVDSWHLAVEERGPVTHSCDRRGVAMECECRWS